MSRSNRDGNIVLISLAVFFLFAVSSLWTDATPQATADEGFDGVAAVGFSDTAGNNVDLVVRP